MKENPLIADCADETLDADMVATERTCYVCRAPAELADEALDGDTTAAGAIICIYCQRCQ